MGSMVDMLSRGLPVPDIAGDYYKLQSLVRQKEMGGLQLENERRQGQLSDLALGEKREAILADRQLKDLYSRIPNPTDADIVSTIGPTKAIPLIKARREASTAALDTQIKQGTLDLHKANRKAVVAGTIKDQPSFEAGVNTLLQEGVISKEEAQRELSIGYTPEMQQQMQWYVGQGYADEAAAHDASIKDAVEKRNQLLFGPQFTKATNEATTTTPNAAGLTASQQATLTQQKSVEAARLEQQKTENIRKNMPNTVPELALWLHDPKRTPAEIQQGQAAMKDLERHAILSRPPAAPPGMTTLMIPNEQGGYTATRVAPGQSVGPGAVTASGMSSINVPTSSTRTMSETAPRVLELSKRMRTLLDENEKQLGPLGSRWAEFTTGKVGVKNRGYAQLRTDAMLLQTALMRMHVGARGGTQMMDHFKSLVDASIQDPDNLRAALDEIEQYANSVKGEGGPKGAPAPAGGSTLPGGITLADIDAEIARRKGK